MRHTITDYLLNDQHENIEHISDGAFVRMRLSACAQALINREINRVDKAIYC